LISFVVCVPLSVVLTVSSKLMRAKKAMLDPIVEGRKDKRRWSPARTDGTAAQALIPMQEFRRYTLGLSSIDDRRALKDYFQAMLSTAPVGPGEEDEQAATAAIDPGGSTRFSRKKVIGELLDKLKYSDEEQQDILETLAAQQQRGGGGRIQRAFTSLIQCCLCRHRQCCGPTEDGESVSPWMSLSCWWSQLPLQRQRRCTRFSYQDCPGLAF
jgi:hypothetical protein